MSKRITVYLLSPGDRPNWKAEWIEPGTKIRRSRSLRTADPHAAERLRADLEYELNNGLAESTVRLAWDAFRERYWGEKLSEKRPGTRAKAKDVFDRFETLARPARIGDVDTAMMARHKAALYRQGLAAASVRAHLAYLKTALRWAYRHGLLASIPHLEMPAEGQPRRIRRIADADLPRLLAAMPSDRWRLLVQLGWYTGMRRVEMMGTCWEAGDLTPWIDLPQARIYIPGEGAKSGRDAWIPIHRDLAAILAPHEARGGRLFAGLPGHPVQLSRRFREIVTRAGLKARLHDLRRTFGCRYAPLVPAQTLMRLMRHANIATTLKYYVDLDDSLEAAIHRA